LLSLLVLVAAAAVVFFVFFFNQDKKLSHTAVEHFIKSTFNESSVTCNGGKNFTMKHNGDSFDCTAGAKTYHVTITDKNNGDYNVTGG
jgi:hypothetical protein